jgi:CofD-related protein of GAK system
MSTTQHFVEYLITGILTLFGIAQILDVPVVELRAATGLSDFATALILIAAAYVTGFIVNVLAEYTFQGVYNRIESGWKARDGNPALAMDRVRYDLYANGATEVIRRMDYHRSLLRIARSGLFICILLAVLALLSQKFLAAVLLLLLGAVALLAYQRRSVWFTKTVYYAWLAMERKEKTERLLRENSPQPAHPQANHNGRKDLHLVVFAGGTGFREINFELVRRVNHVSRIVPIWDNGGSSKILRKHFPVIPVGDVRHALMTMAHGEGRVGEVVKLFNWRLPDAGTDEELRAELHQFAQGTHPLIAPIEPSLRSVIVEYIRKFESALPEVFDLKRGSLGNFVLTGACLTHDNDMNTAIYVFRQLCSIRGHVWPVSLQANLHIAANLEDGQTIFGQEVVTKLNHNQFRAKIKDIFFTPDLSSNKHPQVQVRIQANPLVLDALKSADIVIFGPGSFFTSVLPHIMVDSVADALASLDVPKVLIGNILEDQETYNYTVAECIETFLESAHRYASAQRASNRYLTHVIVNDNRQLDFLPGMDQRYLPLGKPGVLFARDNISLICQDVEDPWQRGHHNPQQIVQLLETLAIQGDITFTPA